MELFRIVVRVLVVYGLLLALLRLAGKRTVTASTPFDFVLALVLGDLVDDALWNEVPMAQFVVASVTLVLLKLSMTLRGSRARADS